MRPRSGFFLRIASRDGPLVLPRSIRPIILTFYKDIAHIPPHSDDGGILPFLLTQRYIFVVAAWTPDELPRKATRLSKAVQVLGCRA